MRSVVAQPYTADQTVLLQAGWLSAKYRACRPRSCYVRLDWRACCFCILPRQSHCSCRSQNPRESAGLLPWASCSMQSVMLLATLLQVVPAVEPAATPPPVDVYLRPAILKGLPREVVLYQYEVCPFCCKVKAFLDYHKVSAEASDIQSLYMLHLDVAFSTIIQAGQCFLTTAWPLLMLFRDYQP